MAWCPNSRNGTQHKHIMLLCRGKPHGKCPYSCCSDNSLDTYLYVYNGGQEMRRNEKVNLVNVLKHKREVSTEHSERRECRQDISYRSDDSRVLGAVQISYRFVLCQYSEFAPTFLLIKTVTWTSPESGIFGSAEKLAFTNRHNADQRYGLSVVSISGVDG